MTRWLKVEILKLDSGDYEINVAGTVVPVSKEEMDNLFNNGYIEASAD